MRHYRSNRVWVFVLLLLRFESTLICPAAAFVGLAGGLSMEMVLPCIGPSLACVAACSVSQPYDIKNRNTTSHLADLNTLHHPNFPQKDIHNGFTGKINNPFENVGNMKRRAK